MTNMFPNRVHEALFAALRDTATSPRSRQTVAMWLVTLPVDLTGELQGLFRVCITLRSRRQTHQALCVLLFILAYTRRRGAWLQLRRTLLWVTQ